MKKIVTVLLAMTMMVNLFAVDIVKASVLGQEVYQENPQLLQTEDVSNQRTNYNFINTSDYENIHYTYDENGKTYCVYESINEDGTEVDTQIYVMDGEVKY